MASLSSLTSSTSSSSTSYVSSGISGLASNLDTDALIDAMTTSTRSKIAKNKQKLTTLGWQQTAYQSISSQLVSFANKYTSYSSSTNLCSSSFYSKYTSKVTSSTNSSKVSVSGTSSSATSVSIAAVKQLASDASFKSSGTASSQSLTSGEINFDDADVSTIAGKSLAFTYGNDKYYITLDAESDVCDSAEDVAALINKALSEKNLKTQTTDRATLGDVLKVSANTDGSLCFTAQSGNSNSIKITGGTESLLSNLGLSNLKSSETVLTSAGTSGSVVDTDSLKETKTFAERLSGQTLTFKYNGTSKTITFDDTSSLTDLSSLESFLQTKLDTAFGSGRISVDTTAENGLSFATTSATTGDPDTTSTLSISSGSTGLLGSSGVFGITAGTANRINTSATLAECGLANSVEDGNYSITINGKTISSYKDSDGNTVAFDKNTTLDKVMEAINSSDANVTISYSNSTDKFTIKSDENGASGTVTITEPTEGNDLAALLFGKTGSDYNGTATEGKDAIVLIDYDGSGGQESVEITRGSNNIDMNGTTISLSGTFGYDSSGNYIEGTEAVKITSSVNSDSIVSAIKSMIEDYNTMIAAVNTAYTEKPDNDYAPLTDEQKEDMTESQITAWETKAKKGVLFADTTLMSLSSELRNVFSYDRTDGLSWSSIGISTSSDYSENGKVTLDEDALIAALESNPDTVKQLFTSAGTTTTTATGTKTTDIGAMTKLKTVMDKYAKTTGATKGILLEIAGNEASATSLLSNRIQTQTDLINSIIENLEDKLESQEERYQSKFTALELAISKMNSQSTIFSDL
ncbi:MAG: flagellar filament capping protein FliD [Lachnospiraceae bacterium]|nr:flagellar filament capping protein FliD [Lachnospiraceae bacterium]